MRLFDWEMFKADTGQGLSTPAEWGLHVSTGNQRCRWKAGHGTEFGNPAWLFLFVVRVSIHRRGRNAGSSVMPKEAITGIYPGLIMETPQHSPSLRWKGHFTSQAVGSVLLLVHLCTTSICTSHVHRPACSSLYGLYPAPPLLRCGLHRAR